MDRERLSQYVALKAEKKQLERRLEEIAAGMYEPKTSKLTETPRGGSWAKGSTQERIADRTRELRKWYEDRIEELNGELIAIEYVIERGIEELTPIMRMVLRAKYIDGMTWEDVCEMVGYSWTQTYRIHKKALEIIEKAEKN